MSEKIHIEKEEGVGDEDFGLASIGFMFDSQHRRQENQFYFNVSENVEIVVKLLTIGDDPGHVISGQYVWPAAAAAAKHCIEYWNSIAERFQGDEISVIELGAGCGLAGLAVAQLPGVSRVVLTDHDPGSLSLLRDNATLNNANEMVHVASLEWGVPINELLETFSKDIKRNSGAIRKCRNGNSSSISHSNNNSNGIVDDNSAADCAESSSISSTFNLILGSDLLYCIEVVDTLFRTIHELLLLNAALETAEDLDPAVREQQQHRGERRGREEPSTALFVLVTSFALQEEMEVEIDAICARLGMSRNVLVPLDVEKSVCKIEHYSLSPIAGLVG